MSNAIDAQKLADEARAEITQTLIDECTDFAGRLETYARDFPSVGGAAEAGNLARSIRVLLIKRLEATIPVPEIEMPEGPAGPEDI